MGLFGTLFQTVVDVVKLPISVAKDAITLGGALTDGESATSENLEEIKEDLDNITDK